MCRRLLPALMVALAACGDATVTPARPARDAGPPIPALPPATGVSKICRELRLDPVKTRPVDLMLLVDRSESMNAAFSGVSRYDAQAALLSEIVDAYQGRIRFGYLPFPTVDGSGCGATAPACCAPSTGLTPAAGTAPEIQAALRDDLPGEGNTPTAAALRQARRAFASLQDGVTERYVLLSTDGPPSCTLEGKIAEDRLDTLGARISGPCAEALAEVDALVESGVHLLLLGWGPDPTTDPNVRAGCLEEMALRGGSAADGRRPAFFRATDPAPLEAALRDLFTEGEPPGCVRRVPEPPPDPDGVTVLFDGRAVPRSRDHGWVWRSPLEIEFTGVYCRRVERVQVDHIELHYACGACGSGSRCQ